MKHKLVLSGIDNTLPLHRDFQFFALDLIKNAKSRVMITTYNISDSALDFIKELIRISKKKVEVTIIFDSWDKVGDNITNRLKGMRNPYFRAIAIGDYSKVITNHSKVLIVDSENIIIGSNNISMNSFHNNFEVGIFISDKALVKDVIKAILALLERINYNFTNQL